jgi:hypothetical protein
MGAAKTIEQQELCGQPFDLQRSSHFAMFKEEHAVKTGFATAIFKSLK